MNDIEKIFFDNQVFTGSYSEFTTEDGEVHRETRLTWKASPEETIKELRRLYDIEQQFTKIKFEHHKIKEILEK